MRYDRLYAIRAQHAVETGLVDFAALVQEWRADGIPAERINQMLLEDLRDGGRIFGKYFRSLEMAGDATISVAESQASNAVEAIELDKDLAAFAKDAKADGFTLDELVRDGNPEALEIVERSSEDQLLTWICTLRKTCEKCLPLHGKTMTRREWRELGLRPRAVHPRCECDFVPTELAADQDELLAPLRREIAPGQEKGGRRTQRAMAQQDVDKAMEARDKAMESKEGRKILKLLGESG